MHSIDIDITFGDPIRTRLSDLAENIEFIPLETRNDVLIGMYPAIRIVDSLVIVYSWETGLFVFDSRTGKFKHKIYGFNSRGPRGYNGSNSPLSVSDNGLIILHQWDRLGVWDYTTGQMSGHTIPVPIYKYSPLFFINDTLLLGNKMNTLPEATSTLDVVSYNNGRVVMEYGFMNKADLNYNTTSMLKVRMSEYADYINYTNFVRDTIYGLNRRTLNFEPRFVLNLGSRIKSDNEFVDGINDDRFTAVSLICETDRYLFLEIVDAGDDIAHCLVFNKQTGRTQYIDNYNFETDDNDDYGFEDDITDGVGMFFPQFSTSDNRVYRVVSAYKLASQLGIKEDDNPVLVIAKLKK